MQLAMIGLGRMGGNMARRLGLGGCPVYGFSRETAASRAALAGASNVRVLESVDALVAALPPPRIVWLMLPAGAPTAENIHALAERLSAGDIVVDGGNAHYRDSQQRAAFLAGAGRNIGFVDVGVSGGVWGLEGGYGLMFGGAREHIDAILPLIRILAPAPDKGWVYCGAVGAGHFAKMVHNGIEYGLMQAYAEGMALMQAKEEFQLPLADIAEAWRHGTVVRSWLLDLTAQVLRDESSLQNIGAVVADSGEGRWTVQEAVELGVPTPTIASALMQRFNSQGRGDFASRILSMLRNQFGGHAVGDRDTPKR